MHLEVLVEEPSMAEALNRLIPRILPGETFGVYPHQGKTDLMSKLASRLRSYSGMRKAWSDLRTRANLRDPDAIPGGTWETLDRILRQAGYYPSGMPKIEVARRVASFMDPNASSSRSFQVFRDGLRNLQLQVQSSTVP